MDALLNGKAIRIEGGNFEISPRRFSRASSHEWELSPIENTVEAAPQLCPVCKAPAVEPLKMAVFGRGGRKQSWRREGRKPVMERHPKIIDAEIAPWELVSDSQTTGESNCCFEELRHATSVFM